MKKKRIRGWVKVSALFVVGVFVVAKMFSAFGAEASVDNSEVIIYHGIVKEIVEDGHVLTILDKEEGVPVETLLEEEDLDYELAEIVTVIESDDEVIKHYATEDYELASIKTKYHHDIIKTQELIIENLTKK